MFLEWYWRHVDANVRVIVYVSRQMEPHEMNYPTGDLEVTITIIAVKLWRHYILVRMQDFTNQKSLQYLFTRKDFDMRQQRWIELLSDYDCTIRVIVNCCS